MNTGHYFSLHSGRNFMPAATSVLNFARSDRDTLGGWASEGSERYSRTAKYKIELMQQAVSKTFESAEHHPLAEADDLDALGTFLKSCDILDEEILRTKTLLVSRTFLDVPSVDYSDSAAAPVNLVPEEFVSDESLDEALAAKEKLSKEKQQVWNRGRSELLGSDHKQTRAVVRANLEPGYDISYSGKKRIKVLHRLGQCFVLPGVDFYVQRIRRLYISRSQLL